MLKTSPSPVLTSASIRNASTSASPSSSFRNAHQRQAQHTHVPQSPHAPARDPTLSVATAPPISHRNSSSTMAKASVSATTSSPHGASMKSPVTLRSERKEDDERTGGSGPVAAGHPSISESTLDPPPSPRPQTTDTPAPAAAKTATTPSQAHPKPAGSTISTPLSPNKRRASPGPLPNVTPSPAANAIPKQNESPSSTKRAKAEQDAPKALPLKYEHCAVEDLVELIAHMLTELITTNDHIQMQSGRLTRFHSRTPPGISVRDYLHRLARHATLIPPILLSMVYYIDRLCAMYPEFTINTLTVHRYLITAATVAAKGLSDAFWNNATYARVGGVRLQELKLLELEFLHRVDWRIVPNPEVLVAYYNGLVERNPRYTLETEEEDDGEQDEEADIISA
ncbi:nuc-1 negative regulatory protein preg [Emericellopsis atlantica]|uniref:Nuc-1 negative regulatory protein preg n=1 Tax=Emericellopsis atlantica TaxID=2614577 RepID=A0A9P7ZQC8_9HYPO|nr:nuc-1 negative regulatory protein preg [Emericellopsis atlantica]KAG9256389.1 nuc-1 negative regulatory protein preg [Emericellopsis atlantica]